jgi:hypothetical protein
MYYLIKTLNKKLAQNIRAMILIKKGLSTAQKKSQYNYKLSVLNQR